MRYIQLPAVLAAIGALVPFTAAGQTAKRPDPESPAGVEYQLPLEQARKNASNDRERERGKGGSAAAPLFGAGIVRAERDGSVRNGAAGGASPSSESSGEQGGRNGARGIRRSSVPGGPAVRRAAVGDADSHDGSATLWIAGIALAVVLAGALAGFGLRRGLRTSPR